MQYICNTYNGCHTAPHRDVNDGTPSPQRTKYFVWPPFDWDSANIPPPLCPSTPKVRKTTVRRAHVVRQACGQRTVPKERMSLKTCLFLTLTTIVATGHYNTMCRQISACSGGPHCPSGASAAVEQKPFPTLRLILNNCTCLPFGAGFGAGLASGFGMGLGFLFLGTELSSKIVGEIKACPQRHGQGPKSWGPLWPTQSAFQHPIVVNVVRHATICGTRSGNISHG